MYTTPKSYLELLKLFISLLEKKHIEADAAIQRLEGGVLKLAESAEAVANLEENLKVLGVIVDRKGPWGVKCSTVLQPNLGCNVAIYLCGCMGRPIIVLTS